MGATVPSHFRGFVFRGAERAHLVVLEARECHAVRLEEGRSEVAFAGRAPSVDLRTSCEGRDVGTLFALRGSRDVILRNLVLLVVFREGPFA